MAMFSKDVQTVLTYLALLIILYGAYKALVGVLEGAKGKKGGSRAKRGLDKIKSRKKLSRKFCRKWNKNIKKRKRKIRKTGNSSKKTKLEKRVQGVAKKMCYVGCKQVGKLGLSCGAGGAGAGGAGAGGAGAGGAGGAGAGAGGCTEGYSSKAEWDEIWQRYVEAELDLYDRFGFNAEQQQAANVFMGELKNRFENNYLKNNCMPTRLVDAFSYRERNECFADENAWSGCKQNAATKMFYLYSKNEIMETADLAQMIEDEWSNELSLDQKIVLLQNNNLYKTYTLTEFVKHIQDIDEAIRHIPFPILRVSPK